MKRREFLLCSAGGVLLAPRAMALGDASKVDVVEVLLPSGTTSRPSAWSQLLYELVQTTSIEAVPRATQLEPGDPKLFDHPFAVLVGVGAFDPLDDTSLEQLNRYLTYGGFLLIDDTSGMEQSPFDRSVRRLCRRLFPTRPLAPLPSEHSVYRSFFLHPRPVGRVATHSQLEGVTTHAYSEGDTSRNITPLVYCRNDLSGALERGPDGRHEHPLAPGVMRDEAIKLGINMILYALTSTYKKDSAHVTTLLRQGRSE